MIDVFLALTIAGKRFTGAMSSKKRSAVTLVLMRHGQSRWNAKNRFTGWTDVRLTEQGERESWAAGRLLQAHGLRVGSAFTSLLTRAQTTARLALDAAGQGGDAAMPPLDCNWRLNERHYGALTGLHKARERERSLPLRRTFPL